MSAGLQSLSTFFLDIGNLKNLVIRRGQNIKIEVTMAET